MAEQTAMRAFDPRLTPARADLAAKELEGKVTAARYVEGRAYEVIEPQAPLRTEPAPDAPLATEALKGERVTIYDSNDEGWAWGQLAADGYVGWLPANALAPVGPPPTHKITALRTFAFPGRSIKDPPVEALPLGARVGVVRFEDRMAVIYRRLRADDASCFDRHRRAGFRRRGGTIPRLALFVGWQDGLGPRLLGAGSGRARYLRFGLPT